jgi:DNA-binding transcriptional regulator YiaG
VNSPENDTPECIKPLPPGCVPGDHIRKRRLDLGLFQRQVAAQLGVDTDSVFRWESNETSPSILQIPRIIRFLGYNPFPKPKSFSEELRESRRRLGLSQTAMARRLGVDSSTLRKWEQGRARPSPRSIQMLLDFNTTTAKASVD